MLYTTLESTVLEVAVRNSLYAWRNDLKYLVEHAKDRFPDVIWEHDLDNEGSNLEIKESIWGHKAIIYARSSPEYHASHLRADSKIAHSPLPYASISSINDLDEPFLSKMTLKPSVFLGPAGMVHLKAPPDHNLLVQNLRQIYYAFEGDSRDVVNDDKSHISSGLDTLQQGLQFAWRARLGSDIRLQVALASNETTGGSETRNVMRTFWSHRFILASRSPYFLDELQRLAEAEKNGKISNDVQALTLPSPPFTPRSLFFILDFIYTGTPTYYYRAYGLGNAFAIYKGAKFLMIESLVDEIRTRIAEEFFHGLFNATLPQEEYGFLIERKWHRMAELGCICERCAEGLTRILEFSLSREVDDEILARGARRAAVSMFGEAWCSRRFSQLPHHIRKIILSDMNKFVTPDNFFRILYASERALRKLNNMNDSWTATVKKMVISVRNMLDDVLLAQPEFCFECEEWMDIMHSDSIGEHEGFQAREEEVEWILHSILRASQKDDALELYKTLLSSVLLRRRPLDNKALFLPRSSYIRTRITDLLKQFSPSNIDLPKFSRPATDPIPEYHGSNRPSLELHHSRALSISSDSTYQEEYWRDSTSFYTATENYLESIRSDSESVSESNQTSIFSYPSSRTKSTYYGFYYTRWALSTEMESLNSRQSGLRRSNSWGSLSSSNYSYAMSH